MKTDKPDRRIGRQAASTNGRFQWRMALMVFMSPVIGIQLATQYLAAKFAYAPVLGASLFHLYAPWKYLLWGKAWGSTYPAFFKVADSLVVATVASIMLVLLFVKSSKKDEQTHDNLHGSARWASEQDLKKAGLLGNDAGVYVGAWQDKKGVLHYLRHNGPEHILTYAPTRSGKGVGLVIPTLLSWPHSALITDLKGELWALTAGWRKQYANNRVIRFEPAGSHGAAAWNSLDEIRVGTENEVGDVQNQATLIVDPDGKGLETHWQKTSQALLVGLILHGIYKMRAAGLTATLPAIDSMLVDSETNIADLFNEMTCFPHCKGKTHPVVAAAARDMIDRPPEEAGSVLSTLKSYLSLYRDPIVAKNVSRSDFRIKDLMTHHTPLSLYIVTQPNDKARLQPLVRLLLNTVIRLLADKMEFEQTESGIKTKKIWKHRLLCMIDEFPSLGKLDILQESLAFVAGYGIKFYLICQDINQLKSRERGYGPDETITSNCHIQNAYPPNRIETAEHLSKWTGPTTIVKTQVTTSGRRFGAFLNQISKTTQEVQRPLLTADECMRMQGPEKNAKGDITKAGDMLVYVANTPAIYGRQPLYFQDSAFRARAAIAAPKETDVLHAALTPDEEIKL